VCVGGGSIDNLRKEIEALQKYTSGAPSAKRVYRPYTKATINIIS